MHVSGRSNQRRSPEIRGLPLSEKLGYFNTYSSKKEKVKSDVRNKLRLNGLEISRNSG